jgi:nucleotide-binding universal stress UspA family protein
MIAIKRLLVPIDFTDTGDRALDYAIELAAKVGADITVMHAYELPIYGFPDGAMIATAEVATRVSTAAQKALDNAVDTRKDRGVQLTALLRDGVPWEEIVNVANELQVDMIVIGTHGRRGLSRVLLGSVAENVIRTSTRPVLTIHAAPQTPHS